MEAQNTDCISLPKNKKFIDRTGKEYGRLTVIGLLRRKGWKSIWLCRCSCGNKPEINGDQLASGQTRSCGCLRREMMAEKQMTHGLSGGKEYAAWMNARARTSNKNDKAYHNYGGRGIKMASEWVNSFEAFFAELGPAPSSNHTLERKDNEKGYEPGNCVWATRKEQNQNKRDVHRLEWRGQTKSICEWSEIVNLVPKTIYQRLYTWGWSVDKALSTPSRRKKPLPEKRAA